MKTTHRILAAGLLAALCAAASAAQAQAVQQQYQYPSAPSKDGSQSPPSTLRITETPGAAAVPIRDTPRACASTSVAATSRTAPPCPTSKCVPAWRNA